MKTRYRQADQACEVRVLPDGRCSVRTDLAQRAVTPGQSAVFYQGDECLGGAVIADIPEMAAQGRIRRGLPGYNSAVNRCVFRPGGSMSDSFKTRTTLAVGNQSYEIHSLPALQGHDLARLPFSLKILLENLLRFEDGVNVTREGHRGAAQVGRQGGPEPRNRLHARARDHAGLHRRAGRRRPRRHARSDDPPRRQPAGNQPARPGRTGHRPLGAGGQLRHRGFARQEQRNRVRPQRRALFVPALGPDGVQQLQGRAAEHRHRAPGQRRAPRARGVRGRQERREARLSRTRSSAPTRTRRWSTASACSAGAWAASRPRPRCSASRSRC